MTAENSKATADREPQDASADVTNLIEYLRHGGDINQWCAHWTVKQARAGDTDAAREILEDFIGAIEQHNTRTWNGPIHWEYATYLAEAFRRILGGDNAALALGVKSSRRGRRRGTRKHDEQALAAAYWFLIRRGYAPELANARLSELTGADRRTIQRASVANGNSAFKHPQLVDDEALTVAFRRYAAEIAAILTADGR